jgi:hypothetical protein
MLSSVTLVRTDVSEELSDSLIRVTRIGELGTTLAVRRLQVPPKRRFLQEPHGVTSQKIPFFISRVLLSTSDLKESSLCHTFPVLQLINYAVLQIASPVLQALNSPTLTYTLRSLHVRKIQ